MGWSEEEEVCRRHPKQIPQPGVCPSCLRERLSTIILSCNNNNNNYYYSSRTKNNNITTYSSSSPSSSASPAIYYYYNKNHYSSASSSGGGSSPANHRRGHHRIASDIMDSIYLAMTGGNSTNALKKSRSMAYVAPRNINGVKKKGGFWNKLMLLRSIAGKKKKAKF